MAIDIDGKVVLTQEESGLYQQARTLPERDSDKWESQSRLFGSLVKRGAIPQSRLRYFCEPEYNAHNTKKSRKAVFEENGTTGEAIYRHPDFAKHLAYFIEGPMVGKSLRNTVKAAIESYGPITSGDYEELVGLFRAHIRPKERNEKIAEECYKLVLEFADNPSLASDVRHAMRT